MESKTYTEEEYNGMVEAVTRYAAGMADATIKLKVDEALKAKPAAVKMIEHIVGVVIRVVINFSVGGIAATGAIWLILWLCKQIAALFGGM